MAELYTSVPLSPLRKAIAARMTEAKRTIPHFRLAAELDVDALLSVRQVLRKHQPDPPLSLNDLFIKACAMALTDVPAINIQWADDEIRQYHSADISIVVALAGGLSTPIIRSAETKSVWEISGELQQLASRAAANKLKMTEIAGGSFSISNLGMFDVDEFDAIINPPQCAILALGRAKPRVVVSPEGEMRIATMLRATLSIDHRALDGVTAATFMQALRRRVEQPEYLIPAGVR
jgi:pyruvate dehydrogenase E2 component (dihydrolipoamide acetyltransferase)